MTTKTKPKPNRKTASGSRKKMPTRTSPSPAKRLPRSWPALAAVVPITTFAPEPFEVLRSMSVVIQPLGDEHLATFFDANINASGETQEEAFANLKDVLLGTFQMLERMSESQLGLGPKRQRAVLFECIRRTN